MDSPLLEDEKFDFDLPLSLDEESDVREEEDDEDEIFFGPVGYNERCVATNTETKATKFLEKVVNFQPLSPLNPEQVVEIFKEATSMALMFRSSSSDAGFGEQENKSSSDCPELINDVVKSRRGALKLDIKDNDVKTDEHSNKSSTTENLSNNNNEEKFVVRKRVLQERKTMSNINNQTHKTSTKKTQIIKKGQTATVPNRLQNKGSGSVTKLQKIKTNQKTSYTNSPLKVNKMLIYSVLEDSPESPANQKVNVNKSNMLTPRRVSSTSSKMERSFSSTKSSSASDTSFTEETTKQSKLPKPSQSGLKPPGYAAGSRKRNSSNSSVSSTSSTSSVSALNETFTMARSSVGSPSSIKKPKSKNPQPNPKPMLSKISMSKPTFAKPNEVPKTSKLQPMKALPRPPAGPTRSMSTTALKSPAQSKTTSRASSAGSTPLRAQTPKTDRTSSKGATSIRRRSNINTSTSSILPKKNQSGIVPPNDRIKKPSTPQVWKNVSGKVGSVRNPTSVAASSGLFAQRRLIGGMKGDGRNEKLSKDTKPTTPESRSNRDKNLIRTPKNTGVTQSSQLSKSFDSKRRRSFIPTPNPNRTMELNKSVDSPRAPSPVPFHLSPTISMQCEKKKSNEENFEPLRKPLNSSRDGDEKEFQDKLSQNPETTEPPKTPDNSSSEPADQLSSSQAKSPDAMQNEEPDLMIQESPLPQLCKASVGDIVDPFSPGIPTPDLPSDGCLNPVVLQMDTKDLIDLSHMSPMPEPDLIDLAAASPIHLVEGKLVDL